MQLSLSQLAWEWIEEQPDFMPNELARELDISIQKTKSILDHLVKGGCVFAAVTTSKPHVFKKVEGAAPNFSRARPNPHKPNNSRQRIWAAIRWRQHARFTINDLAEATLVSPANIRKYLSGLVAYGYAKRIRHATGGRNAIFKMQKITGHRYPQITNRGLYDPNTKQLIAKEPQK